MDMNGRCDNQDTSVLESKVKTVDRRIKQIDRGVPFEIHVNGHPVPAYAGETVAGALVAAGIDIFRTSFETGAGRGQFCGMGVCYDCLVTVDGAPFLRACMTAAKPRMDIAVPALPENFLSGDTNLDS